MLPRHSKYTQGRHVVNAGEYYSDPCCEVQSEQILVSYHLAGWFLSIWIISIALYVSLAVHAASALKIYARTSRSECRWILQWPLLWSTVWADTRLVSLDWMILIDMDHKHSARYAKRYMPPRHSKYTQGRQVANAGEYYSDFCCEVQNEQILVSDHLAGWFLSMWIISIALGKLRVGCCLGTRNIRKDVK
jgi:hypothetical protein